MNNQIDLNKDAEYEAKFRYKGDIAKKYNETRVSEPIWQREQDAFRKILAALPSGSSVIDIPLGTGRFIPFYKELGLEAQGVDISSDMLEEARQSAEIISYQMKFILGDAKHMPQDSSECNYLICARLLNWVSTEMLELMLQEFIRITNKGLILQIRVGKPLTKKEYFDNLIYRLRNKPKTIFHPIFRRIFHGKPVQFYIHEEVEIEALFKKYSLEIADRAIVDKAIKLEPGVYSKSIVYTLNPK